MSKHSIYNYIIRCANGELRLYNSLSGDNSLIIVPIEKVNKINKIFQDVNKDEWKDDVDFVMLKSLGYIVDDNRDETSLARCRLNDVINQPELLLTIMPTEDCNFRCLYCYEDHNKGKMNQSVQDSIIKFVRKNLNRYTSLRIAWFGGEPLEALDVIIYLSESFMHLCKVARKNYSASMTTNGYSLDINTFKKLVALRVYNYQITLDGLKGTHDKYRFLKDHSGTFDKIISNLKDIASWDRNSFEIAIRTNFTKEIYSDLNEYLSFCEDLFGDDDRFSLFVHMVGNWGGDAVDQLETKIIRDDGYPQIIRNIVEINPKISFKAHLNDLSALGSKCYASLRNSFVIGSDGIIYKCTENFKMKENRVGLLDINGNMIFDNDNLSLWNDWTINSISQCCSSCAYYGCCLGGPCPKVKIERKHELITSGCPRTKGTIEDIVRLLDRKLFNIL